MGCILSKKAVAVTPRDRDDSATAAAAPAGGGRPEAEEEGGGEGSGRAGDGATGDSMSFRLGNLHRYIEGEQVAAGWPAWLSAVAGEAIHGWVPLKSDSFEKLEKIGQGTYSSVFRARDLDSGKIVALKKVRFDNFEPESVRFMAREIKILRRLDHTNVIKLEGLITSRLSSSLYLVFEYMDHDLAGLSSSPNIKFMEPQIKCYMRQLLSGLEHCHSRGVIHRDIKGANLLVNNEGVLKLADFGLANFCIPGKRLPLTSRVITLWYRPPELILGSTDYEASVDLWSVGCVFAEMFLGKPILQGRTEVEQLHKIFKLCGSPPEEYWKKSKLPHATIFKPHHPYNSCLTEAFKNLPASAFSLLEMLLSVEPYKRGTASTAITSEYFTTKPYASDPSSLPKYPPNKEMNAKIREESRKKATEKVHGAAEATMTTSKTCRAPRERRQSRKLDTHPEERQTNPHGVDKNGTERGQPGAKGDNRLFVDLQPLPTIRPSSRGRHVKHISQGDVPFSGPLNVPPSGGFTWVKKSGSRSRRVAGALDASNTQRAESSFDSERRRENGDGVNEPRDAHGDQHRPNEAAAKHSKLRKWSQLESRDPHGDDGAGDYYSQEFSRGLHRKDSMFPNHGVMPCDFSREYRDKGDRVEFSGPLLSQTHKVDELLQKHERHIRQAVRRSWFRKGSKNAR